MAALDNLVIARSEDRLQDWMKREILVTVLTWLEDKGLSTSKRGSPGGVVFPIVLSLGDIRLCYMWIWCILLSFVPRF